MRVLDVEGVGRVTVGRCLALWKAGVRRVLFLESALNRLRAKPVDYLMLAFPLQLSQI